MTDSFGTQTGFSEQLEIHEAPPELNKLPRAKSKKVYVLVGVGFTALVISVMGVLLLRPKPEIPQEIVVPTPTVQPQSTGIKLELLEAKKLLEAADPNTALQPPPAVDMKITF